MKSILIFSFVLCSVGFLQAQTGAAQTTRHGYRFIRHSDHKNPIPQFEDDIVADVKVFVGDSLMQHSRSFAPDGLRLTLPTQQEFENSPSAPALMDVALLIGKGDSATAFMQLDSFIKTTLPEGLRKYNEVRYEIKLLDVINGDAKREETKKRQAAFAVISKTVATTVARYNAGEVDSQLAKRHSGLKILLAEDGKGEKIQSGENVAVHYYGCLKDGLMFDNSFERGEALEFAVGVGQMIPGFDEGVLALKHGSKAYLFLPPNLGYGDQANGSIPANSELIFYIEIQ